MRHLVRAVVFRKKADGVEFLLLHKVDPDESWWQTVAGGWEEGESWREGAVREMKEETGLEPRRVWDLEYEPEFDGGEAKDHFFAVEADGEVDISGEHDSWRWVGAEEAIKMLKYEFDREGVKRVLSSGIVESA